MTNSAPAAKAIPIGRQASELYKLFFLKLPRFQKRSPHVNTLDVEAMAVELDVTTQNIYRWFKANELPARRAKQIINLPGSLMTMGDLEPFITSN